MLSLFCKFTVVENDRIACAVVKTLSAQNTIFLIFHRHDSVRKNKIVNGTHLYTSFTCAALFVYDRHGFEFRMDSFL